MPGEFYVQPVGLVFGKVAHEAIEAAEAGALAGGSIAFTSVRLITRAKSDRRTELRNFSDVRQSSEQAVEDALGKLTSRRISLAGLSLDTPRIMGVVNVTPDSFSDGGLYNQTDRAVSRAAQMMAEGADIIDIGGESTRPGADLIDPQDELNRVLPVISDLKGSRARLSIDTRKAKVMAAAEQAGVHMVNDVSALTYDAESIDILAASELPIILMHARGTPKSMQEAPAYDDVLLDVYDFLASRISACQAAGISNERLVVDPGIGFGKQLTHNLELFAGLTLFHALGVPLMLGASRKSFIGALTGETDPVQREPGSLAAALAGFAQGAHIVRVHEVADMVQARAVWQAVMTGKS